MNWRSLSTLKLPLRRPPHDFFAVTAFPSAFPAAASARFCLCLETVDFPMPRIRAVSPSPAPNRSGNTTHIASRKPAAVPDLAHIPIAKLSVLGTAQQ